MAITSTDIQEQSFKIERRGYDVDEVDVFLEHVASEIDQLNNEIASLRTQLAEAKQAVKSQAAAPVAPAASKEAPVKKGEESAALAQKDARIAELEARVRERKNEDAAIAQALIVAQRTGDELVSKAKADAENEKAAAMQQADAAVRDMVVTAAARMVAMKDAKESDRALYDKFLAETKEA